MGGAVVEYEVLRPFSGGPNGTYQAGDRIPSANVRPSNAASLIERRYLRPIGLGEDPDAERLTWQRSLAPYLAIATPEDAPADSRLAQVTAEAAALETTASGLEARVAALREQLAAAQAVIDDATESADFSKVANAQAEVAVVTRLLDTASPEARRARVMANETARDRNNGWAAVQGSRQWLDTLLAGSDAALSLGQQSARWSGSWRQLTDWLGNLEPAAKAEAA